jgi:hypothetical protein
MVTAVAVLLALPASAHAITVTGTAAPTNTTAGAHSNVNIHIGFTGGQVKDLTIGLPPGLIGDPNATPLCTVAQLNADACPANTVVGAVSASATLLGVVPATVNGSLYNLQPQPGEPARFGIVLHALPLPPPLDDLIVPPIILQSGVHLRPDYGLNTVINDIPNSTQGLPTTINSQDITLFGIAPGTGKPFMRNPTSCGPATTTLSATPYQGPAGNAQSTFTPTNCGGLDFSPSFTATVGGRGQTASGVATTVTTVISQDPDEAGLLKAAVTVPNDFNPNAALFGGACDQASFQASSCALGSVVGSAIATSPLLSQPLSGPVMLVNAGGQFPNLGLNLQGQLHLLLLGSVDINKTVVFDGLPDIPIAHFLLNFSPSPGLLGNSRDICVPPAPVFHADFQGYNGASTSVDARATVEGCGPVTAKKKCKKVKKKRKKRR